MARVLFLQNILFEFIGVSYISAVLKKNGHRCDLIIEDEEKDFLSKIKKIKPDLIAFSTMTGPHKELVEMARKIKENFDIPIIVGGAHPTFFPEVINDPNIDMICVGEGEYAILELADSIDNNENRKDIKNIWFKKNGKIIKNSLRPLIENLDELPFPDRSIYDKYEILRKTGFHRFMCGRGCPYNCTFCFNHKLREMYSGLGKYIRYRSVGNVIKEINEVDRKYKIRFIRFIDDTFTLNKKWLFEFLDEYKKTGIPFSCAVRANEINDEIIRKLKWAGCVNIMFGVEAGSEKTRNRILKKSLTNEQILKAAETIRKYKIKFGTYSMFGLPETLKQEFETVELNIKIKPDYPFSTILQPYPKTEISNYMVANNMLSPHMLDDMMIMQEGSVANIKNINEMINLERFYSLVVKYPLIFPIIKQLIKLPPNRIFKLISDVTHGFVLKDSVGMSWLETIEWGIKLRGKI